MRWMDNNKERATLPTIIFGQPTQQQSTGHSQTHWSGVIVPGWQMVWYGGQAKVPYGYGTDAFAFAIRWRHLWWDG
jgi:hypothetical protein